MTSGFILRQLGRVDYAPTFVAMKNFTVDRTESTPDEIWICEHPPVFTQGLSGKAEHLLDDIGVPIVQVDRGGQITYHGPGQVIAYLMLDLRRRALKVRELVTRIEQAIIDTLADYEILGERHPGAPGVYVGEAKIAALGLRIKNGCSYHGLSLNVRMDLNPYRAINPCGFAGLAMTQISNHSHRPLSDTENVAIALTNHLKKQFP